MLFSYIFHFLQKEEKGNLFPLWIYKSTMILAICESGYGSVKNYKKEKYDLNERVPDDGSRKGEKINLEQITNKALGL